MPDKINSLCSLSKLRQNFYVDLYRDAHNDFLTKLRLHEYHLRPLTHDSRNLLPSAVADLSRVQFLTFGPSTDVRQEHKQAGRPHRRRPGHSGRGRGAPPSSGTTAAATSTSAAASTAAATAVGSMRFSPQQAVPVPLLRQELQLEADPEAGEVLGNTEGCKN